MSLMNFIRELTPTVIEEMEHWGAQMDKQTQNIDFNDNTAQLEMSIKVSECPIN